MGESDIGEVVESVGHWLDQAIPDIRRPAAHPDIRPEPALAVQS
jgi:hypothetical protein